MPIPRELVASDIAFRSRFGGIYHGQMLRISVASVTMLFFNSDGAFLPTIFGLLAISGG
jgi:hypothetical protein